MNMKKTMTRIMHIRVKAILLALILLACQLVYLNINYSATLSLKSNSILINKFNYNELSLDKLMPNGDHVNEYYEKLEKDIKNMRLIFVGGYPRSGTTLMRAILDVHESIYCGPETRILPILLNLIVKHIAKPYERKELENAGIKLENLNKAMALFIYSIMYNHGKKVVRLCAKDPDMLYYMEYLNELFPKAQFIYMIRDGRASAYSSLLKFNERRHFDKFRNYLNTWNMHTLTVYERCVKLGVRNCLMVRYEQLVLHSNETIRSVMNFLNEKFSDDLMHHEKFIGSDKRVKLSPTELSSDQVLKPIYLESLVSWIHNLVPNYDSYAVKIVAPMLTKLNYSLNIDDLDYFREYKILKKLNNSQLFLKVK